MENKIVYPFDTPEFLNTWKIWEEYKRKQHSFKYKSEYSLQGALNKLSKLKYVELTESLFR